MSLSNEDVADIDLLRFIDRYRLPGECDECATDAAALATGYPDHVPEACATEGCRNYDAAYAEHLAAIDKEYEQHRYTVDVILHGAEPYPCVICGGWRQDARHEAPQPAPLHRAPSDENPDPANRAIRPESDA